MTRAMNRGTPQNGAISPLLQLIIMVVAYANDLVILVLAMFPSVMSDIMESALRKLQDADLA